MKLNFSQESIIEILHEVCEQIKIDRDLALDRFRRQDETIDGPDAFYVQGKIMAEYLRIASDRTNELLNISKLIAGVVFKTEMANTDGNNSNSADIKKELLLMMQQQDFGKIDMSSLGSETKKDKNGL